MAISNIFTPEQVEGMTVKWAQNYSWPEIAKEYGNANPEVVKACVKRHILVVMSMNDRLEKLNSELWERRFKVQPKQRVIKY